MHSHDGNPCTYAARVILVELASRVALTRSVICAVQNPVPQEYVNGCYSADTLA